jgi:hypothetical protein
MRRAAFAVLLALLVPACTVPLASRPAAKAPLVKDAESAAPGPSHTHTPKALPARFYGAVLPFTHALAAQLRHTTWHQGCPVDVRDLRLLTLRYWGFDGRVHQGPMVVNASVAHDVVLVFRRLFQAHFPIRDMHLANRYRPGVRDDPRSKADYTDGFNCRPVVTAHGPSNTWSMHAYGLAIDVNPRENPYVTDTGFVYDVFARRYRNRALHHQGMVHPGDAVVRAFATVGWKWAGYWQGEKDYMHFSVNGH